MADLYDRIEKLGEAAIDTLVQDQTQEGLQLEFKEKDDPTNPVYNDNDRRNLGKILSAFSNSAGGVVIWGIKAKRGGDGIDCARLAVPISDIAAFHSHTISLVGQLLQPKHDGIEILVVTSTRHQNSGYLVLRVARSDRRPHRSEAKGHQQYFKRSGDSSFCMEHYDIEDAFRRISVPELSFLWTVETKSIIGDGTRNLHLVLQLVNNSRLTAKYPYLQVSGLEGARPTMPTCSGYQRRSYQQWDVWEALPGQVINPGTKSPIVRLDSDIVFRLGQYSVHKSRFSGPFMKARIRYGCENSMMRATDIYLNVEDLEKVDATIS